MSHIVDAWFSHPEVQSLLDRAHRYRHYIYAETGSHPDRFMVTEEEYCLLKRCLDGGDFMQPQVLVNDEIQICGMRVCRPARLPWHRDNRYMQHIRPFGPIHLTDSFTLALHALEPCRTERPLMPQRDVTCPCGEVIWDLAPCGWPGVYTLTEAREPLRPLDDLDEGLQCCGRPYPTFADFMAHRRKHGEG